MSKSLVNFFNLKLLKEIQGFFSVTRFTYIAEDNYAKPQFICVAVKLQSETPMTLAERRKYGIVSVL